MNQASAAIPGGIELESIDLNWSGGQTVRELRLTDAQGKPVARVRQIETSYSLLQLARGSYRDGKVVIEGLELDLELDESGSLNLAAAVAEPGTEDESKGARTMLRELIVQLPGSLDLVVELRDARISMNGPGLAAPVVWSSVNGTLSASGSGKPVELDLKGIVGRSSQAALRIGLDGFDADGRLQGSNAKLRLAMDASWEEGKDAARSVRMLRSLLGPNTEVRLDVVTAGDSVTVSSSARSSLLEFSGGAVLDLQEADQASLRVASPIQARYRITPEAIRMLAAGNAEVELDEALELTAEIESFGWATGSTAVAATARIALGDGQLNVRVGETTEAVDWSGWSAALSTSESDGVQATLSGRLLDGNVALNAAGTSLEDVRLNASVKKLPLDAMDRVAQGFTGRAGALVEWLGPQLDLTARYAPTDADTATGSLVVKTARLDVNLPLSIDHKAKTVRGTDADVRYALAPGLVPKLANQTDLPLRLRAQQFRIPLGAFDAHRAAVDATLSIGRTTLAGPTPVTLDRFECRVVSESLAQSVALDASGKVDSGSIEAHGKLGGLWDADGRFGLDRARGQLEVVLSKFPAARIEPALGKLLDARVSVRATGTEAQIDLDCRSDLLVLKLPLRAADRRAALRSPGSVRYRVTPETARRFTAFELERPCGLELAIESMSVPLAAEPDLAQTSVQARLTMDAVTVADMVEGHALTLSNADFGFAGESVAAGRLTAKGEVELRGVDLGGPVVFAAHASRSEARLGLKSNRLTADVAAERSGDVYRLTKPARAMITVHRALLDAFDVRSDWLGGDLAIRVDGKQLQLPADFALERMKLDVDVGIQKAALRSEGRAVELNNAKLGVVADGGDLRLSGSAGVGDGTFELSAAIHQWIAGTQVNRNAPIDARLTSRDLPAGLIDPALPNLVGQTLGINARIEFPNGIDDRRGGVTIDAKAPRLSANADLRLDQGMTLASPARLVWTLSPAALRELLPEAKLRLREAAQFTATVKSFRRSADGDMQVDATAVVPLAALVDANGQTTEIRNLSLAFSLPETNAPLKVTLEGAMEGGTKPGRLAGTLTVADVAQTRSLDELTVRGTLSFSNVAVKPIDALLALDGFLPAVLGDEASAALTLQLVRGLGPVDLRLTSGNLKANVAASIIQDAYILRKPIVAELVHSKALADQVLPKLGPFFQGIVATEKPIAFRVNASGFSVPRKFDFNKIIVPSAVLDIGKVTLENQLLVQLVKQLARADTKKRTDAWFTPVQVRLSGGSIRYTKRLDLLFEKNLHFATWGTADIGGDRLDMVIGIMPDTINRALGIKRVGANDTLQVKVRGSLAEPKFNLGKILRDMAAIRAKEDAVQRLPGIAGKIAEGALDALLRKSFSGAPPVPASVDPLPWAPRDKR